MVEIELHKAGQTESEKMKEIDLTITDDPSNNNCDESHENQTSNNEPEEILHDLVDEVRKLLRENYESEPNIYSHQHYEEIMDPESAFTCWRYLKHRELNVGKALELMLAALKWRKENEVDEFKVNELSKEIFLYAPVFITGKTRDNLHDVLYTVGRNYRKPDPSLKSIIKNYIQHVLFSWDAKHRYDLDKITLVFDVQDTGIRNIDLEFTQWLISIRDFIPARVNQIYIVGIHFLIRPLIRMIISWLPEQFREITHCGTREQLVDPNIDEFNLPVEAGSIHRDESSYRKAPVESPWSADSSFFSDPAIVKAIQECIGFSLTEERKERLKARQQEFEREKV